jgi:hypothetical protein
MIIVIKKKRHPSKRYEEADEDKIKSNVEKEEEALEIRLATTRVKPHSVLTKSPNWFLDSIMTIHC